MADKTAEELLAELGIEVEAASPSPVSAHDERVIAGFEDIQRFVDEQGRVPQHGESRDIFERMYAVRLDRLRAMPEAVALLTPLDRQGLLQSGGGPAEEAAGDAAALLAQLGIDPVAENDITSLKHVRPTAERKAADEIANRSRCEDFEIFKPLFEKVRRELDGGVRQTRPFEVKAEIDAGRFFIVGGQMAYVAEKGEEFTQEYGDRDARLRVIYDNGTESNVLMRSLQRALNKDEAGRRITEPGAGPLFADTSEEADVESGTIYVLRSKSTLPYVAENRDIIHKIGVTGGKVETRISAAKNDPTYLLADVEIVATYELFNINRVRLEALLHRFLTPARLDLELPDRFGKLVRPREWYLIPLSVIDQVVAAIQDGSIDELSYDPATASLIARRA
ncbi:MAG TPA: GIY-YIG nuclease family protein [Hyphomonas sp.]|nr:hypothetical protein [Hyphomonas sp.]HRK68281.1 GIY-YIG nuclease family protein [Hyphomonas sp.]